MQSSFSLRDRNRLTEAKIQDPRALLKRAKTSGKYNADYMQPHSVSSPWPFAVAPGYSCCIVDDIILNSVAEPHKSNNDQPHHGGESQGR